MEHTGRKPVAIVLFGMPTKASHRNEVATALVASWKVFPKPVVVTTESVRSICYPPLPIRERSTADTSLIYGLILHAAELLLKSGRSVIVSGVFEDRQTLITMASRLNAKRVYIKTSADIARERHRPEVKPGSSFDIYLRGLEQHFEKYERDFEVDTGMHSPEEAARLLLAWLGLELTVHKLLLRRPRPRPQLEQG